MELYPAIEDVMKLTGQRCSCGCKNSPPSSVPDGGCLQILISSQALLYIAYALAEAAGAEDISNINGAESAIGLMQATTEFLGTIAVEGYISWDLWFRLAVLAMARLSQNVWVGRHSFERLTGKTPLCSVSGSTTIVPRWFDLD